MFCKILLFWGIEEGSLSIIEVSKDWYLRLVEVTQTLKIFVFWNSSSQVHSWIFYFQAFGENLLKNL